jgi:hypothetical protein
VHEAAEVPFRWHRINQVNVICRAIPVGPGKRIGISGERLPHRFASMPRLLSRGDA